MIIIFLIDLPLAFFHPTMIPFPKIKIQVLIHFKNYEKNSVQSYRKNEKIMKCHILMNKNCFVDFGANERSKVEKLTLISLKSEGRKKENSKICI